MPHEVSHPPRPTFAVDDIMDAAPRIAESLAMGLTVTLRPVSWHELAARVPDIREKVPDIPAGVKRAILEAYNA